VGGTNTVAASRAANFTLTDSLLTISGGGTFTLVNVHNANLTGGVSGSVFDVRAWTGTDTLNSLGGANPVITPRGVAVSAIEGQALTGAATASFNDGGAMVASNYTASLDWGDGSLSSPGTASIAGSHVTIQGGHAYHDEGSFTLTTTFGQGTAFSVIVNSKATVTDAALAASSSPLSVAQGLGFSNLQLATFTDANGFAPISDFAITITWGDGSSSASTPSQPSGPGTAFVVSGSHFYSVAGPYLVTVAISDVGGQTASTQFTLTVQPSIFVLNPSASGALTLTGSVNITIGGAVVVDSSSASALSAGGTSQIHAGVIDVVGGVSAGGGAILAPTPVTGIKPLADPLAGLAAPGSGANLGAINLSKGSLTINPGTYTQIKVSGTGTVLTMNPGIYIIAGGGFSVSNSAQVQGLGVTIYNAGSNILPNSGTATFGAISLGSSGAIGLSAPTTGPYAGILIFQSRDNTQTMSLGASSVTGLSGTIYAPSALLSLSGGASLKIPAIVNLLTLSGNGGTGPAAPSIVRSPVRAPGQLPGNLGLSALVALPPSPVQSVSESVVSAGTPSSITSEISSRPLAGSTPAFAVHSSQMKPADESLRDQALAIVLQELAATEPGTEGLLDTSWAQPGAHRVARSAAPGR
jgi:hypothetical protein